MPQGFWPRIKEKLSCSTMLSSAYESVSKYGMVALAPLALANSFYTLTAGDFFVLQNAAEAIAETGRNILAAGFGGMSMSDIFRSVTHGFANPFVNDDGEPVFGIDNVDPKDLRVALSTMAAASILGPVLADNIRESVIDSPQLMLNALSYMTLQAREMLPDLPSLAAATLPAVAGLGRLSMQFARHAESWRSLPGHVNDNIRSFAGELKDVGLKGLRAFNDKISFPLLPDGPTPLSHMKTGFGLITEPLLRSPESLKIISMIGGVYAFSAAVPALNAYGLKQSADVMNNALNLKFIEDPNAYMSLALPLAVMSGSFVLAELLERGAQYLSKTTHIKTTEHVQGRFHRALETKGVAQASPNAHEIIIGAAKDSFGNVLGLSQGAIKALSNAVSYSWMFAQMDLHYGFTDRFAQYAGAQVSDLIDYKTGTNVEQFLHDYGGAGATSLISLAAVAFFTRYAFKMGEHIKEANKERNYADAERRTELVRTLSEADMISHSDWEKLQNKVNDQRLETVLTTWGKQRDWDVGYGIYRDSVNLSSLGASFGAAFMAYMSAPTGTVMGPGSFFALGTMIYKQIGGMSWFLDVMPELAGARSNIELTTSVARHLDAAHDQDAFHAQTGMRKFDYQWQDQNLGVIVRNLWIHLGDKQVHIPHMIARPGDRIIIKGPSGCGKTSFLNALREEHDHGQGMIVLPECNDERPVFYASQEWTPLNSVPLKDMLAPVMKEPEEIPDEEVIKLFNLFNLSHLNDKLHDTLNDGKPWRSTLSGGEKRRVQLIRAAFSNAPVYIFDEVLDPIDKEMRTKCINYIMEQKPDAIIFFVSHETEPTFGANGLPIYNKTLLFDDQSRARLHKGYITTRPETKPFRDPGAIAMRGDVVTLPALDLTAGPGADLSNDGDFGSDDLHSSTDESPSVIGPEP